MGKGRGWVGAALVTAGLIAGSGAAKAEAYQFSFVPNAGGDVSVSGVFVTDPDLPFYANVSSVTGNASGFLGNFAIGAGSGSLSATYVFLSYNSGLGDLNYGIISGPVSVSDGVYSGTVGAGSPLDEMYGTFTASPTSSASSGGAPSPELDAALGLLLAGGVTAFLLRGRRAASGTSRPAAA